LVYFLERKYGNMKKKTISFIVIFSVIILLAIIMVEARYDPRLQWQVLESPHFSIYFYKLQINEQDNKGFSYSVEQIAQQIADIAEETYHQINAQLGPPKHHHLQKIAIIIEDFSDYALGFASSFPHRVIRISLTIPTAKSFDMKFKSWLKMVIAHEYTHISHFEMTSGPTTALRALFGQILAPNALQPIWSIEGLAVYNETIFTPEGGGRGIDSRYDMYLRMATLGGKFNTLDQINGYYLTSWPGSTAPYIYGQSLVHFIAQKYGEDKVITLSKVFSEYPYLGFNYALKKTIGLDLNELYQSWKDNLKEKYQLQAQKILSQKKLTPSQQLTKYNYWVDYPRWISMPDGDKIIARISTPHSYPFLQIIDPLSPSLPLTLRSTNNQTHPLIKRTYGRASSYNLSTDNSKIIYAKLDNHEQFYRFYDLYLFDLKTEKETRLSEGLRARDPDWYWSPSKPENNPRVVAVINNSGTNNLALINLPSLPPSADKSQSTYGLISEKNITHLTNFYDGSQIYQPSWSPQGDMIALSAWRQGYQDIYILNFDSNDSNLQFNSDKNFSSSLWPIFKDQHVDLSPCWSPDSKFLFFSSDRTGIYNIFAFSLSDKKLYQITNILSGAFQPALSPDGKKLAYIEYHATGYELHLMEINPDKWTEIEYVEPSINLEMGQQTLHQQTDQLKNLTNSSKSNYPIHTYNPLSSIWPPTYWIPAIQLTENDLGISFSTELEDVLGFSSLPLSISYDLLNNILNYNFNYYNYSRFPILNLYLSGNAVLASQAQTSWWTEGKAGVNIYFPFEGHTFSTTNSRSYRQTFSLGYQYEKSSTTNAPSPLNTKQDKISSLRLSYSYSDTEKYGFSISPELGNSFSLTYKHSDKILGSDYTFDKLIFDGRKFIPLPPLHQVLALRLVAGFSSSNITNLGLDSEIFKLGGNYSADNLSNIDVNTFSLRGYKPATLEGNNLLLTSLEYRFPLANIEHNLIKLGPLSLFLERFSGTFFIDIGNAWESTSIKTITTDEENEINSIWQDFKSSIGVELKADFNNQFDYPFTLRIGAAKALSNPKGYDIYITLGTSF